MVRAAVRPAGMALVVAVFLCCLLACAGEAPVTAWVGTVDSSSDTVIVTTTTSPTADWPRVENLDSMTVVWRSDTLNRPSAIATGNDNRLYVADGPQVFVLHDSGRHVATIGRRGRGPGEFRSIDGIAALGGDTLLVWDGAERRLTWLCADGRVIRTQAITPPPRYQGTRRTPLWPTPAGVVLVWRAGLVRPMGPPDSVALTVVAWGSDSARVLATTPDVAWVDGGTMLGPRYPFGQRPLYTVGPDGQYAYADGVEYCVTVRRVAERGVRRVCRRWERQAVGTASRQPRDTAGIGAFGRPFAAIVAKQEFGDRKNSIEDVRIDALGQPWVRVVNSAQQHHPMYMDRLPQLRPAQRRGSAHALERLKAG